MRVRVYRNIHASRANKTPTYSILDKATGKVIDRRTDVELVNVRFIVSQAGRARVLKLKHKKIHAFAEGDLVENPILALAGVPVTYNPFKYSTFVEVEGERPIHNADRARFNQDVRVWKGASLF